MIVRRILVPDDVDVARVAGATEKPRNDITLRPSAAVYERKAGFVPGEKLFAEAMLENSSTKPPRRAADFLVSATVQTILVIGVLALPFYFTEALDIHQFNKTLLAAPPPAAPLAAARPAAPKRNAISVERHFEAPRVIPSQVARVAEEPGGNDLESAALPGEGVPGGVPGGIPGGLAGGVLGGGLSVPAPPVRIDSAPKGPKAPIRVGGVKRPRLIFGPEPEYPVLAKHSRISGAVVIDAVIDAQGNVVDMHPVSGHPLLIVGAMAALRQWKYEPTMVGGQACPVQMLVTITFELN